LVKHLEQHPLDNEVREKLAMIYAEHYQRLDLAADQFEQLITDPAQPGREVARWLNVLADLQLKHGADYDTIRQTLQRVIDLFPELAAAQLAQQRIELLRLELKGKEKSQVVKLGSYEKDLGLKGSRRPNA
jgi:outer membrane protein assembly factor BamD (BamD/ComL family)